LNKFGSQKTAKFGPKTFISSTFHPKTKVYMVWELGAWSSIVFSKCTQYTLKGCMLSCNGT
jgi:hypothetical protein